MKKMQRNIAIVVFALAVGVLVWWAAAGASIYTKTSRMVEVKDDLFGTTTQKWEKDFIPGLDLLGPIAGVLIAAGGIMLYWGRKKARSESVV